MALSPGAQRVLDMALASGKTEVTSTMIPAAEREAINAALAAQTERTEVSDEDVANYFASNADASDAEIVAAAKSAGVDAEQIARVTGVDQTEVETRINTVVDPVIKELQGAYTTFLDRDADEEGLDYWENQVNTGALSLDQAKLAIATSAESKEKDPVKAATASLYGQVLQRAPDEEGLDYFANEIKTSIESGVDANTALRNVATSLVQSEEKQVQNVQYTTGLIDKAKAGDINAYGELLYLSRKSGTPMPTQLIEQIGYSRSDDKTAAYNYSVGAQGVAEGLEALDEARASGDTTKAAEIESALASPDTFWTYYNENIADKEGQAHINLRKETADGNPFEIGDPGEYQTSFWEGIGDIGQDILENPVFQMALALNPATAPFAPFIGAMTTKLSGDEISGLQVAGMLASAPGAFSQGSTLAGTQYGTGFLSDQSLDLFNQQVGLEPSWFTVGENISSGITTESDLLRGAQQGGVSAAAQALSGASDTDQLMAFINKQMVDLGGLDIPFTDINIGDAKGMLSDFKIPGLNISLGDLPDYKLPGFDVALGDIPDFRIPGLNLSLNEINAIAGNLPDFNFPTGSLPFDVNLPEFATNFGDINIPNINIPTIDIPNVSLPTFETPTFETPTFDITGIDTGITLPRFEIPTFTKPQFQEITVNTPDVDLDIPELRLRMPRFNIAGYTPFGVDSEVFRGGRGLFAQDDEEVQRISELLLAGLPQIGGAGS